VAGLLVAGVAPPLHAKPTANNKTTKANNIRYGDFMILSPLFKYGL
jgi:hypothetical protein